MIVHMISSPRIPSRRRPLHAAPFAHGGAIACVFVLTVCAWIDSAWAVPARPGTIAVRQPGGESITLVLRGDEHAHWYEDAAGRLVVLDTLTRQWVYASWDGKEAKPTSWAVGRDQPQPEASTKEADTLRRSLKTRRAAKAAARAHTYHPSPLGTCKNLVILVNFTDLTVSQTRQAYDDLFNAVGYSADGAVGSVKDFYTEVTYGALTVESTVVEPVTLDHDYAFYGQNDAWGDDVMPQAMVRDALLKLEERGFDFSQMDGDGDGYVDGLTIIHAGVGEEIGTDPNAIWSHMWEMGTPLTLDGVVLQTYCTTPASRDGSGAMTRIGVICHEMGHVFGLPDLYDYDYDSEGAGRFCLMAGGSWNGTDGERPSHPSAYCKVLLGWVEPTLISVAGTYSLGRVETNPLIYKIQGSLPPNEYFLIENRQGYGFDAAIPGSTRGILIWHVDSNQPNNDDQNHYMVDLEEAGPGPNPVHHLERGDNTGEDSDYFRLGNATEFNDLTKPNSLGYEEDPLGFGIENISASAETMTFRVRVVEPLAISGYILTSSGVGIDNVLVTEDKDGGWDITDTDGYYRVPVRIGWSGTITPTKTGYTFAPVNRTYANVLASVPNQNYTGVDGTGPEGGTGLPITITAVPIDPNHEPAYAQGSVRVFAVASGGVAPYRYVWNTGLVWPMFVVVPVGITTYTVTVTDALGATGQNSITLTGNPPALVVAVQAEPNVVLAGQSSTVTATASGGTPPYTYLWSTGETTAAITVAPTQDTQYAVTVTDAGSQTASASATVRTSVVAGVTEDGLPCLAPASPVILVLTALGWMLIRPGARRKDAA